MEDIREAQLLDFWRHPAGAVGRPVRGIIAFASLVTLAIALVGPRVLWRYYAYATGADRFWFENGLAIVLGGLLVVAALPGGALSRYLRIAVALPCAHAVAMILAWASWSNLRAPPEGYRASRLIEDLPIGATVELAAVVLVVAAWLIARGRRGERGHALVMLALSGTLLLGLWLPIASDLWCRVSELQTGWSVPWQLIVTVVVPPAVVAVAFTAIAVRRPQLLPRLRTKIAIGVFGLFLVAMISRLTRSEARYIVFSNFLHVLLAVAFLGVIALIALGARIWLRGRHAAAMLRDTPTLTGVVADDGDASDVVASIEITSWLRGPRATLRRFALATPAGEVLVPGGTWVAPLAASTTQLRTGESVAVLRRGDRVVVAGMVSAGGAHPFRSGSAWLAGPGGISVTTPGAAPRAGSANLMLALWRPCVAYLAILIAIGAPALVAAAVAP